MDNKDVAQLAKDYLVAVPLLGSALAFTFDVGYFSGIDINLFTLFTIGEHLVFALEALPLGIGIAVGAFAVINYFEHLERPIKRVTARNKWAAAVILASITVSLLVAAYYFNRIMTISVAFLAGIVSGYWKLKPPSFCRCCSGAALSFSRWPFV